MLTVSPVVLTQAHVSGGKHLGMELLGHRVRFCLVLVDGAKHFSKVAVATQASISIFFSLCFLIRIIRFPQVALNSPGLLDVVMFQIISTSVMIMAIF